ncbi:hypothetical protein IJ384_06405 [bacterium]|nr:hypothetical protein [bacterium]
MVYTILISIVFIAELIIAVTVIQNLLRLDKKVIELNDIVCESRGSVSDISVLMRKISEQWVVLSRDFVDKTKADSEALFLKQLSKIFLSVFVLKLNIKLVNRVRRAKATKIFVRAWSLLENMV